MNKTSSCEFIRGKLMSRKILIRFDDICPTMDYEDIVDFKEYSQRELGIPKYEMCIETLDTIKARLVLI